MQFADIAFFLSNYKLGIFVFCLVFEIRMCNSFRNELKTYWMIMAEHNFELNINPLF